MFALNMLAMNTKLNQRCWELSHFIEVLLCNWGQGEYHLTGTALPSTQLMQLVQNK